MSYYSAEEMKKTLKDYPKFQKRLYCRGFLITNEKQNVNWTEYFKKKGFFVLACLL